MAKRDIYNRQQRARRPRKPAQLTGTPLPPNVGVEEGYAGALDKMTNTMVRATNKTIAALTAAGAATFMLSGQGQIAMGSLEARMAALFEAKAREMAASMLRANVKHSANSLGVSLESMAAKADKADRPNLKELSRHVTLKGDFSAEMKAGLREAVEENVKLIKSIPKEYYAKIQTAVVDSITEGQGLKDLIPKIQHIGGVTQERAHFIALDQTRKANAFISRQKMLDSGITKFRWRHVSGSKTPRPQHLAPWTKGDEDGTGGLNGGIFEIGKPPIIDPKTGERGFPGQLINCRCVMEPVIDFTDAEEGTA